jgi:ribonuclease BN (tRNA processing enzyme)
MPRLIVLGSGTFIPTKRRGPAGYALLAGEQLLIVDSGSGTLGRLATAGLDYRRISQLFYTHVHPDHTADLVPLLFALNHTPDLGRNAPLQIFGPEGFAEFLRGLEGPYPWIQPTSYSLEISEVGDSRFEVGVVKVESRRVEHAGIPALAYRVTVDGRSVVFSGDTSYCDAIVEIAREAHLLVIEASVPLEKHQPGPHLTAANAGRVAAEAKAKEVLLTHFYPVCDDYDMAALCRQEYDGPVRLAEDLLAIDITAGE